MTAQDTDCDVLIVGLGPVGAALAVMLADRGLRVIAVEKDVEVYPLPRAAHFDHEIMRLFQQMGLADEVSAHVRPAPAYEFRSARGELLMAFASPTSGTISGWAQGYMFNQPGLETALRARLADSPMAEVRLAHRFVSLEQDPSGVTALVEGPDGVSAVRARYLVGCDGAHSPVRGALGIGLSDYRFDEPWLVVDAVVGEDAATPKVNLQICDPARPTTCVLMGPGRHRWEFMLLPGESPEDVLDEAFIQALIAPWNCGPDIRIDRRAVYRFHGLVAETWRKDRVILAGDSAHQTPPFAGQGMCSGLRDAANLAWKLDAILKAGCDDRLLDTYQPEREPNVRAYIELAIGMGALVCNLDVDAAAARDAGLLAQQAAGAVMPPAPQPPPFAEGCILTGSPKAGTLFPQPWTDGPEGPLRLDDVMGEGAWMISRTPAQAPATPVPIRVASLDQPRLAPFAGPLAAWLEAAGAEAVLVRPDRYVFGAGSPKALGEAFAAALS